MSEKTKVIFRTDQEGITFALFPEEVADHRGFCDCYEHVGQHGAADYFLCVDSSRPATEQEYAPLLEELQRIGYDLEIYKKRTPQMRDVFKAQLAESRRRS